jgi:flagellar secretion chaperone FliS
MSYAQGIQYLEAKIRTAPSYRLHLMLVEGALRFGRQAEGALRRGDLAAADGPLMRVIDIVCEILAAVRERKTDLNTQIAKFYLYLFRLVSEAKVNDDVDKLAEALRLLEFERETWQLVCQKLGPTAPQSPAALPVSFAAPTSASPGISLEA